MSTTITDNDTRRERRRLAGFVGLVAAMAVLAVTLTAAEPAGAAYPGANGKIAFASYRDGDQYDIFVMNADGSGQTNLTNNPAGWDLDPAWSPDGTKIAFVSNRESTNYRNIYVMNADGSGQTNLTLDHGTNEDPAWSPDGSKIAFTSSRGGDWEVYVMNADGSGLTNLTQHPGPDVDPAWSPDGSKIAYVSYPNSRNQIYVMNADGTDQTNLTQNTYENTQPTWSPDGSKIAFSSYRNGGTDVYAMNDDGSQETNLTPASGSDYAPSWSPDGSKIAFITHRDGNDEVYVMNSDGSFGTNLTNNLSYDAVPSWQTVPSTDLALSLGTSPDVAKGQKPLTYTATVTNLGGSNAAGIVLTDALPADVRFLSASPSQGTCDTPPAGSTGTVTCNLGFLPRGQSATVELAVSVVGRKTAVSNTASITAATPDPNAANNSVTIATPVK